MRLFISYAHTDQEFINDLVDLLQHADHAPWYDRHLLPGQRWKDELRQQIVDSDALVFVISPTSVASEWCEWELVTAIQAEKPILPILHQQAELPDMLQSYQYVDFTAGMTPANTAKLLGGLSRQLVTAPPQILPAQLPEPQGIPEQLRAENIQADARFGDVSGHGRVSINQVGQQINNTGGLSVSVIAGLAIVGLVIVVIAVALIIADSAGDTITGGDNISIGDISNTVNFGDLVINNGDSPEVIAAKKARIAELTSSEIWQYTQNVDLRLQIVEMHSALIEAQATDLSDRPSIREWAEDANLLGITQDDVNGLRAAFQDHDLPNSSNNALINVATDIEVDLYTLRAFYERLEDVQEASDNLLEFMQEIVNRGAVDNEAISESDQQVLELLMDILNNRGQIAYVTALDLLQDPDLIEEADDIPLEALTELTPTSSSMDNATISQLYDQYFLELIALQNDYRQLVEARNTLMLDDMEDMLIAIDELVAIQPGDTWDIVAAKAITLRQFDRDTEAIAAFRYYAETFGPTDPTAEQYAETAIQFTLQFDTLDVIDGAVYVFEVGTGSIAEEAGLQPGDIIISFNDAEIRTTDDMSTAIPASQDADLITITYLRLNDEGTFDRVETTLPGAEHYGLGMMPI